MSVYTFNAPTQYYKINLNRWSSYQQDVIGATFLPRPVKYTSVNKRFIFCKRCIFSLFALPFNGYLSFPYYFLNCHIFLFKFVNHRLLIVIRCCRNITVIIAKPFSLSLNLDPLFFTFLCSVPLTYLVILGMFCQQSHPFHFAISLKSQKVRDALMRSLQYDNIFPSTHCLGAGLETSLVENPPPKCRVSPWLLLFSAVKTVTFDFPTVNLVSYTKNIIQRHQMHNTDSSLTWMG